MLKHKALFVEMPYKDHSQHEKQKSAAMERGRGQKKTNVKQPKAHA